MPSWPRDHGWLGSARMALMRDRDPRAAFAATIPKPAKRRTGRTVAADTPLNVRSSGLVVGSPRRRLIHESVGRKLGKFALHIERVSVRVEDVNGPKGGVDKRCRIKVTVSGRPSLLVEKSGRSMQAAFDQAIDAVERAVRREIGRAGLRAPIDRRRRRKRGAIASGGTARPDTSASEREPGEGSTAVRNLKARSGDFAAKLEDSARDRPSRLSTRKSANRTKRDAPQRIAEVASVRSPSARAHAAAPGKRRRTSRV